MSGSNFIHIYIFVSTNISPGSLFKYLVKNKIRRLLVSTLRLTVCYFSAVFFSPQPSYDFYPIFCKLELSLVTAVLLLHYLLVNKMSLLLPPYN